MESSEQQILKTRDLSNDLNKLALSRNNEKLADKFRKEFYIDSSIYEQYASQKDKNGENDGAYIRKALFVQYISLIIDYKEEFTDSDKLKNLIIEKSYQMIEHLDNLNIIQSFMMTAVMDLITIRNKRLMILIFLHPTTDFSEHSEKDTRDKLNVILNKFNSNEGTKGFNALFEGCLPGKNNIISLI